MYKSVSSNLCTLSGAFLIHIKLNSLQLHEKLIQNPPNFQLDQATKQDTIQIITFTCVPSHKHSFHSSDLYDFYHCTMLCFHVSTHTSSLLKTYLNLTFTMIIEYQFYASSRMVSRERFWGSTPRGQSILGH